LGKVTILGSCSIISFPEDIEQFFDGNSLVDIRNGHLMEMDALPLFLMAKHQQNFPLQQRIIAALINNLTLSGGDLWRCGIWGHAEVHLRFSSVALRLMILNPLQFTPELLLSCLKNHIGHNESCLGGTWFYHDSIETNKQSYYSPWQGQPFMDASINNMLILNTHVDTLTTLLMAKQHKVDSAYLDQHIDDGLKALMSYFKHTQVVGGVFAWIDGMLRNIMLLSFGRPNLLCKGLGFAITRLYYRKARMWLKAKMNIRAFNDGFLERDIRLAGPNLDYHIVNIWDMAKLLLWLNYTDKGHQKLTSYLEDAIKSGMQYCVHSGCYQSFMLRLSQSKGVGNELLEAIAIMLALGSREPWLVDLYLQWRKFSPPSVGIMGIDNTLSGITSTEHVMLHSQPTVDCIPFADQVVVVNHGHSPFKYSGEYNVQWCSNTDIIPGMIPSNAIAVLKLNCALPINSY
jgi:hypothetical protein